MDDQFDDHFKDKDQEYTRTIEAKGSVEIPDAPRHHDQQYSVWRRNEKQLRKWLIGGGLAAALGVALIGGGGVLAVAHANQAGDNIVSTLLASPAAKGHRYPHGGHGAGALLTVTGVSNGAITAKRPDGSSVTIKTTSSTTYVRAGKAVSLSAVTNGEHILVRGTRNGDGSITATRVDVVLPGYFGAVTAISGNTITVLDRNGSHTVHVSSSTTFISAGQQVSLSNIKPGERIAAKGTLNGDGSLNAAVIQIALPLVGGQITAINGNMITVQGRDGATHTVDVSPGTKLYDGKTQIKLSDLKTGERIIAEGTLNSSGSLNALAVYVAPTGSVGGAAGRHGMFPMPGNGAPAPQPAAPGSGTPTNSNASL